MWREFVHRSGDARPTLAIGTLDRLAVGRDRRQRTTADRRHELERQVSGVEFGESVVKPRPRTVNPEYEFAASNPDIRSLDIRNRCSRSSQALQRLAAFAWRPSPRFKDDSCGLWSQQPTNRRLAAAARFDQARTGLLNGRGQDAWTLILIMLDLLIPTNMFQALGERHDSKRRNRRPCDPNRRWRGADRSKRSRLYRRLGLDRHRAARNGAVPSMSRLPAVRPQHLLREES